MRIYELGFILKPDLPETEAQASVDAVKKSLTEGGATIDKVDDWGKRRLAYRVRGFWSGHYVFIQYSVKVATSLTSEVERRLRVADHIIKYMTIRIDEDLKRLKKAKARRAKRAPRLAAKAAARAAEMARPRPTTPPGRPRPEKPRATTPAAGAA
jgi:small subunit ribosomal protein S6